MGKYYFITSLFAPIEVGHMPYLHFEECSAILKESLSTVDYASFCKLREYVDLENLRAFLQEEPLDPRGNLSAKAIEDAINHNTGLPEFVYPFLAEYSSLEDRLEHFPRLFSHYFAEEIPKQSGFLKEYFSFERDYRLVLCGYRAKRLDRDVAVELQYEDSDNDIVAQIMAQRDARTYEPPYGYEDIQHVLEQEYSSPLELHKALCEYRFDRIADLEHGSLFSVNRVLGYMARLMIVERWVELDAQEGKARMEKVLVL